MTATFRKSTIPKPNNADHKPSPDNRRKNNNNNLNNDRSRTPKMKESSQDSQQDNSNFQVCVRVRPFLTTEISQSQSTNAWDVDVEENKISQSSHTNLDTSRKTSYNFDRVFAPSVSTQTIYENTIAELVQSAMEGYHASVLAYGQTNTGKTYTMMGNASSSGIIPLAVQNVFGFIEHDNSRNNKREYLLRMTYMEIYNEKIYDLLAPVPSNKKGSLTSTPVQIFGSRQEGIVVRGLEEKVITTPQQVFEFLKLGEERRKTGSTNVNKQSSRSHSIFRLIIESKDRSSTSTGKGVQFSSLSLVDLAGSECLKVTGATGVRQKEGQFINKSLSTLGRVIYKLSDKTSSNADSQQHIPYRESKLTRLLQPSLSGNAKMCIIANISPLASNLDESINTLKFASRAKRIEQKAKITEIRDEKSLLESYRNEINVLKLQLEEARSQQLQKKESQKSELYDEDDEQALIVAIQYLERLILKNKTKSFSESSLSSTSNNDDLLSNDDKDDKQQIGPITTSELHSIKNVLGSVLKNFGSPDIQDLVVSPYINRDEELEQLRTKLREEEVSSSLRKADSSFLQVQLKQKDQLLEEVSKIVEAVENRQLQLESENQKMKREWARTMALLKAKETDVQRQVALLKCRDTEIEEMKKLIRKRDASIFDLY